MNARNSMDAQRTAAVTLPLLFDKVGGDGVLVFGIVIDFRLILKEAASKCIVESDDGASTGRLLVQNAFLRMT
ncbi:MAG TPA: hypothetical protein VIF02_11965 [Methylocella sp.]|jgi:hypothetical protein